MCTVQRAERIANAIGSDGMKLIVAIFAYNEAETVKLCLRSYNGVADGILVLEGAHRAFREVNGIDAPESNDGTLDVIVAFVDEELDDKTDFAHVSNDWLNTVEQRSAMFSTSAAMFGATRDDVIIWNDANFLAFGVEDAKRWLAGRIGESPHKEHDGWYVDLWRNAGLQKCQAPMVYRADPNFRFYQNHQWVVDGEGKRLHRLGVVNYLKLVDIGHLRCPERIALSKRYQTAVKKGEADQTWI